MRRLAQILAFAVSSVAATSVLALPVPSGHALHLQDQFWETLQDGSRVFRLRFVMPAIASDEVGYMQILQDFEFLCQTKAVPEIASQNLQIDQIIISLSDRETVFGVSNPEATQYFEAFTLKNNICILEAFQ